MKQIKAIKNVTIGLLLLASLNVGCSNTSPKMVIAPNLINETSNKLAGKSAFVEVNDLRNKIHIIEISKKDKAAELISSHQNLSNTISESFKKTLSHNGLDVNDHGENQLTLIINTAEVNVQQTMVKYKATSLITLTIQLLTTEQTFTKTYNSKINSEGVLNVDIAVLERDFNQQLTNLFEKIVNDDELHQFLK